MTLATEVKLDPQQLSLATEAFVWGFPRMIYAHYLAQLRRISAPLNRVIVVDRLAEPEDLGANVDTLYGVAWLDVGNEPVVVEVPDTNDRYYSFQMIDVYANNFAYIGRRATGTSKQQFLVAGPGWQGNVPEGMKLIRSPSRGIFCFLRTLIDGEADLSAANKIQSAFGVSPLSAYPKGMVYSLSIPKLGEYFPPVHSHLDKLGAAFFDRLGDALASDPPAHPRDLEALARFAPLGIGQGRHPAEATKMVPLFEEAVRQGNQRVFSASVNAAIRGWSVNLRVSGDIEDPLFKATINRFGIGTLSTEEAIYMLPTSLSVKPGDALPAWSSLSPDGKPLNGKSGYLLHFPADKLPPVDAFWSLTMYETNWNLYRNPLDRYAIGDRSPDLVYNEDGSLDIFIQHEQPSTRVSNWLPAPEGVFQMIFRAYQPRAEFRKGEYMVPALKAL